MFEKIYLSVPVLKSTKFDQGMITNVQESLNQQLFLLLLFIKMSSNMATLVITVCKCLKDSVVTTPSSPRRCC